MNVQKYLSVLLGVVLLLLSGCVDAPANPSEEKVPSVNFLPGDLTGIVSSDSVSVLPSENVAAVSTETTYALFPSANQNGVYLPRKILYFYDFSMDKTMVFCALPGCKHSDKGCLAYLENAKQFCEYHNFWYTVMETVTGDYQLQQINPTSGSDKTIYKWEKRDNYNTLCNRCVFSNGQAYVTLYYQYIGPDKNSSEEILYQVDIESGTCWEIENAADSASLFCIGASQSQLAIDYSYLRGTPLSEDEYRITYGSVEDYPNYIREYFKIYSTTELRIYDLKDGDYYVLADSETNGYVPSTDPAVCYGNKIAYLLKNDIYIFDLNTTDTDKIVSAQDIKTYWILDGKIFYTIGEIGNCRIQFVDLDNGKLQTLRNQGSVEHMVFGISSETLDKFIGLYPDQSGNSGKQSWIEKEDFYNDNYSTAHLIG